MDERVALDGGAAATIMSPAVQPAMLDIVRTSLHRAITSPLGDGFLPLRLPKDIARRVNAMIGEPLCSESELARRRAGQAKLEALKGTARRSSSSSSGAAPGSALRAPVTVYVEKDRNARMLGRIRELLDAKEITYKVLDVADDAVAKDFVLREAKCKDDDLPVVFVASTPVGGYNDLVDWDVSGRLAKALEGR